MKKFIYILLVAMLFVCAEKSTATEPYETMKVGLQFHRNVNQNRFHDYWHPPQGLGGFIEFPFYAGQIAAGIDVIPYHSKTQETTNVSTTLFYLSWGIDIALLPKLSWYNGTSFGDNFMVFEDEIRDGFKYESEIALMFTSKLEYRITKNASVFITSRYFHLLTHHRIDLIYAGLGTSYSFSTPQWIKEFLE
ncbi:hypothetical protein GF337_16645 [candidate division KSB1 bacterium]|nr:hypothetical protein [candidate division KSB1 bacterium]